jgi:PPOX class probable F420-dependent enzyme
VTQPARHDQPTATPIVSVPFRPLGGQPPFQPDDLDRFLSETRIATLSYVRADGRPNQTPIWYDYTHGQMRFVATTGSAKHRALQRDPHVSVIVQDDRPPYRAVIIDGTIELIDLGTDSTLSQRMAVKYFGESGAVEYERLSRAQRQRDGETLLRLVPIEVKGFDNTHTTSEALLRSLDTS